MILEFIMNAVVGFFCVLFMLISAWFVLVLVGAGVQAFF